MVHGFPWLKALCAVFLAIIIVILFLVYWLVVYSQPALSSLPLCSLFFIPPGHRAVVDPPQLVPPPRTIHLVPATPPPLFQVFVRGHGTTLTLSVTQTTPIGAIQQMIFEKHNLLPEEMWLSHGGKPLLPSRCIADYDIQPESTLHCSLRLTGGSDEAIWSRGYREKMQGLCQSAKRRPPPPPSNQNRIQKKGQPPSNQHCIQKKGQKKKGQKTQAHFHIAWIGGGANEQKGEQPSEACLGEVTIVTASSKFVLEGLYSPTLNYIDAGKSGPEASLPTRLDQQRGEIKVISWKSKETRTLFWTKFKLFTHPIFAVLRFTELA